MSVRCQDSRQEAVADEEGYFQACLELARPLPAHREWHTVLVESLEEDVAIPGPVYAHAQVLVPSPADTFGVISDVDDTIGERFLVSGHRQHKLAQIEQILACYPNLPFILIGDSGQADPEIYRQVVDDFPQCILAIYIPDVTLAAAEHAAGCGFIVPETLANVRSQMLPGDQPAHEPVTGEPNSVSSWSSSSAVGVIRLCRSSSAGATAITRR